MSAITSSCTKAMAAVSNGIWQGDNPIHFALPLLIVQICLVLAITRLIAVVLKPLRQPRVIAEIIGGILLGPSALGRSETYLNNIFPKQSVTVLDTVADLGLIFFLFLVGLELDLKAIKRTGKQALSIAGAGITVPFVAGMGVSVILHRTIATDSHFVPFLVFMGVAMSITAFPVLARILAERKLLTTDVGQMAMSAAAVNDVAAWILLALAVALSGSGKSPLVALWVLLCGVAFVAVMFLAVRPLMARLLTQQSFGNEPVSELHVAATLAGVLVSGFVTDAVGIHAIFGAFVFGLVIPKEGGFAGAMVEKMEDLVTTLMLPLYFAASGLKTNIGSIQTGLSLSLLLLVITTACVGKILGTVAVASAHSMSLRKSLTLGFLMNTKGLVELIVLNIGKDRKVLNDETFAIMVLMALITTFITTPSVMALYKPARPQLPYGRRVLYSRRGSKDDGELRVLACVHGMPNVHATINLVEAARGTRKETLRMYILHLVQLTERPSSIMKVQKLRKNGLPSSECHDDMDSVVLAFEAYGQLSKVAVKAMSEISSFEDMDEDICAIAAEKRAAFLVIPFHKHARRIDGVWESSGESQGLRSVNQKVLLNAPCSVGILVDRGIGIASLTSTHVDHNVAVVFYGGPDDREALAFACRMVEHPGVRLKVFRFVQASDQVNNITVVSNNTHATSAAATTTTTMDMATAASPAHNSMNGRHSHIHRSSSYDMVAPSHLNVEEEQKLDAECLEMVLKESASGENSRKAEEGEAAKGEAIVFEERGVRDALEAAVEVGKMEEFTLLVVGRGRQPSAMVREAIEARQQAAAASGGEAEYAELGPVGDALVTHSHHTHSSILVIQRHDQALVKDEVDHSKSRLGDSSFTKSTALSRRMLVATGPRSSSCAPPV